MQSGKPLAGRRADTQPVIAQIVVAKIAFCRDDQVAGADVIGGGPGWIARRAHPKTKIRLLRPRAGATDTFGLHRIVALAQTRRIGQGDSIAADHQFGVQHVARRSRDRRDDGGFARDQGVEQR